MVDWITATGRDGRMRAHADTSIGRVSLALRKAAGGFLRYQAVVRESGLRIADAGTLEELKVKAAEQIERLARQQDTQPAGTTPAVAGAKAAAGKDPLADALLAALDVLRHCVTDGPGCDDAAARQRAIAQAEEALRAAGVAVPVAEDAPLLEGYGVKVRKAQVRAKAGREDVLMDEWQVWKTTPPHGRYAIARRFDFQVEAEHEAATIRALRKKQGMPR